MNVSNSKIACWRRCPRKYRYRYVEELESKVKARPLELGSWIHTLLEAHYLRGAWMPEQIVLTDQFNKLLTEEREALRDLPSDALKIMEAYVFHYRKIDSDWKAVQAELDETVSIAKGLRFQAIIDLLVRDQNGDLWIWDHKVVSQFSPPGFWLLDSQLARYVWALGKLGKQYQDIRGVVFNEIRSKPPTVPKLLKSGKLEERADLYCDPYTYYQTIREHGLKSAPYLKTLKRLQAKSSVDMFRRTELPRDRVMTKRMMQELVMSAKEIRRAEKQDEFPRTVDRACQWDCEFKEPCILELQGGDTSQILKERFKPREKNQKGRTHAS